MQARRGKKGNHTHVNTQDPDREILTEEQWKHRGGGTFHSKLFLVRCDDSSLGVTLIIQSLKQETFSLS